MKNRVNTINKLAITLTATFAFSSMAFATDAVDLEEGKTLFTGTAQPIACAVCHTLDDAGTSGDIGPNLDELQPGADRIRKALINGMGAMPSFADSLDDDQREAITQYVLHATGQSED